MTKLSLTSIAICILAIATLSAHSAEAEKPYLSVEQLRAKYADPAGRITKVGGVEVYYQDEGQGEAILMVHGSQSTLKTWDRLAPLLTKNYRVIRFDIPPQGLSGTVTDEAAARMQVTDIAEGLLKQLGVKQVTYVGVSSGGTLGVFLAAKRLDLVTRLILSNTPAATVTTDHLKPDPVFEAAQREAKEQGVQSQHFWNTFLDYFAGDPQRLNAKIREQYYDVNRRAPEKHYLQFVARVADQEKALDAMSRVTAPTLLIWGGYDALLVPASMDTLAGYLEQAQVSTIMMPDVGHYPPLEAPERFAQLVAAYIEAATPLQ